MSNEYYSRSAQFAPRTTAKGDSVKSELDSISAGFEKLPKPIGDGSGFSDPVAVGEGTESGYAATIGQLTATEAVTQQNKEAAKTSEDNAKASENAAKTSEDNAKQSELIAVQSSQAAAQSALQAQQAAAGQVIDDSAQSANKTYSSTKIESHITEQLAAQINDTAQSSSKSYSSEKVESLLSDSSVSYATMIKNGGVAW